MTIKSLKQLFEQELKENYSASEANELFYIFAEKLLGFNKIQLINLGQKEVPELDLEKFKEIISDLITGKPHQYILGETEFFGNMFCVNENVLIPRPETEEMVDIIIQNQKLKANKKPLKILDIGTGSGCIPISLAKKLNIERIDAIDVSPQALEIAQRNAVRNNVKINFLEKDYLHQDLDDVYDIIVSNPPYIDTQERNEIEDHVKKHEPTQALFAPKNSPLAFYEKIALDCQKYLNPNGEIYLEINQKLGKETLALYTNILSEVELKKDLSGNNRFVIGRK